MAALKNVDEKNIRCLLYFMRFEEGDNFQDISEKLNEIKLNDEIIKRTIEANNEN